MLHSQSNVGALIVRVGVWGMLYHVNVIGNPHKTLLQLLGPLYYILIIALIDPLKEPYSNY